MLDMLIQKISEPISTSMKSLSLKLELDNIYGNTTSGTYFVGLLCFFCLLFVMPLCASVYLCLVVTCWERADLLALVCGV